MLKFLSQSTRVMAADSKFQANVYAALVVLIALGQFACASGSGGSAGSDTVSGGVHTAMNVANTMIGVLVLIPRTRAIAALLSAVILILSMTANYTFYGVPYFLKLLPFDGSIFLVSVIVAVHYAAEIRNTFKNN